MIVSYKNYSHDHRRQQQKNEPKRIIITYLYAEYIKQIEKKEMLYHRTSFMYAVFSFFAIVVVVGLNFIFIWLYYLQLHLFTLSLFLHFLHHLKRLFSAHSCGHHLLWTVTRFDWGNKRMLTLVDKSLLEHTKLD